MFGRDKNNAISINHTISMKQGKKVIDSNA